MVMEYNICDIAILMLSMGARAKQIRNIFVFEGRADRGGRNQYRAGRWDITLCHLADRYRCAAFGRTSLFLWRMFHFRRPLDRTAFWIMPRRP